MQRGVQDLVAFFLPPVPAYLSEPQSEDLPASIDSIPLPGDPCLSHGANEDEVPGR